MGYGGGDPSNGRMTRATGDGGIDEDALDLDAVCIQAKRYDSSYRVGRPDLQRFVGSLTGGGATVGTAHRFAAPRRRATSAVPTALIATKILESLLEYDGPGMTPMPGLAESWEISDDTLTYTFRLRPDMRWHDGQPFTSADVKFSIRVIAKGYHSCGRTYFGNAAKIDTPDDHTAVLRLSAPIPYLLRALQASETPMLPRHAFTDKEVAEQKVRQAAIMQGPIGNRSHIWRKNSRPTRRISDSRATRHLPRHVEALMALKNEGL
ncbi:MAG: ABC transporter substrate-binding protein [Pseudorhodobacter sp.]